MRSVLTVLGIACLALLLAIGLSHKKDLSPAPQDDIAAKQAKEQQQAIDEANKAQAKEARDKLTKEPGKADPSDPSAAYFKDPFTPPADGVVKAVMSVEGRGDVEMELNPKDAPLTVTQFGTLIKNKFYDGIRIHRVKPGFVVQAGDPLSKTVTPQDFKERDDGQGGTDGLGAQGSGRKIPFEENKATNEVGTIAMALSGPKTSTGDSQFFINLVQNSMLDGDYCVFGKVTRGMDVVEKIQRGDKITQIRLK